MLLLFGGTAAYRLSQSEVQKIETATGKSAADLTDDSFRPGNHSLGYETILELQPIWGRLEHRALVAAIGVHDVRLPFPIPVGEKGDVTAMGDQAGETLLGGGSAKGSSWVSRTRFDPSASMTQIS